MNARRLAVTENNIAYRTADFLRIQRLDFVVGIEVHTSGNHTSRGHKGVFMDICDELQGRYPKDFKFTGWHPHCRCYATTILKTADEMATDEERIMRGEEPTEGGENEVRDVPQNFKDWVSDNKERIAKAKSMPYFIRDNSVYVVPSISSDDTWGEVASLYEVLYDSSHGDKTGEQLYKASPLVRFDLPRFDRELAEAVSLSRLKGRIDEIVSRSLKFAVDEVRGITAELQYSTSFGVQIIRFFFWDNGVPKVEHILFDVPKALQKSGLSKRVLKVSYSGYKRAGIEAIELYANIDVGGYAWARYGFTFRDGKKYLLNIIESQGKRAGVPYEEAVGIVERWYERNATLAPFPMNLLTGYPWSKDLLISTGWYGVLNLRDVTQIDVFERYLGIK